MATLAPPQPRSRARPADAAPESARPANAQQESGAGCGLPLFLQRVPGVTVQAKRLVNAADDPFEREADAVAERVTRSPAPVWHQPFGARVPAPPAIPAPAAAAAIEPPDGGTPLGGDMRARVEPVVGADLSRVRVHDSQAARQTADALHARAFTHQNHIWLGSNERANDQTLLAHEAAHVVHQSVGGERAAGPPPAIQRQADGGSSSAVAPPPAAAPLSTPSATGPALMSQADGGSEQPQAEATLAAVDTRREAEEPNASAADIAGTDGDGGSAAPGEGGGAPAGGGQSGGGQSGGEGGGDAAVVEGIGDQSRPVVPETAAGDMETGDLVLIDVELAEHQRWEGALGRVGAAGSVDRAAFIAEQAGSGFISGAASGLAMGLGIGLVTKAVPALGPIIGGGLALHGLVTRDWAETGATIGRFGQGSDTYQILANSIASVSAAIDIVSQVLTVINGIVGIVQAAAAIIAGGAVIAAFFTFGATLGIAAVAADVVAVCEEISLAISAVTSVLDEINAAILQPCVLLFTALHEYTSQADPREVEAHGQRISTAAAASGAALGAWAGGRAAHLGGGAHPPEDLPPSQRPAHETPPAASGEGPTVRSVEAPITPEHGGVSTAPGAAPEPILMAAPAAEAPVVAAAAHPDAAAPVAAAAAAGPAPAPAVGAGGGGPPGGGAPGAPGGGGGAGAPPGGDFALTGRRPEAGGMVIHEYGRPGVDSLEHFDVDAAVARLDPDAPAAGRATSDTFFELPAGRDAAPGQPRSPGLSDFDIRMNPDPTRIQYHENMTFEGVTQARIAEHGDVAGAPRGATRGAPGTPHTEGSVLPDNPVVVTTSPQAGTPGGIPVRGPASPRAGEPFPVEVRTHSANPSPQLAANAPHAHSRFNPTTQVNTENGRYLLPDGRWVPVNHPDIGSAHYPAGGRDRGPLGLGEVPGIAGGVPTPPQGGPHGGGGAPPPAGGPPPPAPAPAPMPGPGPAPAPGGAALGAHPPAHMASAAPAVDTASQVAAPAWQQLDLPGTETPHGPQAPRRPTPDEVAPARTQSAYLRRLRAEAEGRIGPDGRNPDGPGRRPSNIARHEVPDRANIDGIWQSTSPTPDLYQYSPRQPVGSESHHVEQQSAFVAPGGGEVIPGYNPREDVTVMMPRTPEHQATFAAQAQQRADPNFHQQVGTAGALDEAHNIAVWGTRAAPPPGTNPPQLMDPRVAGQTVMEHSAYLFERNRLSGDFGTAEGISPRPGETPLAQRPIVGELLPGQPGSRVDPYENIDWDRTFNQPDPYRASQPAGTQLGLPTMEWATQRPGPRGEQLTLPRIDQPGVNPNQLSFNFSATPGTPPPASSSGGPPSGAPPGTSVPTGAAAAVARPTVAPTTPAVSQTATPGVSWGMRAHQVGELFLPQVFGAGGHGPTYAEREAAHRAQFTQDNQPAENVERVNPQYPSPPGTPAQVTAIQNEIMNLLTVRATAEREAQNESQRAEQCEANRTPIRQTIADANAGISAVQAHDAAIARREAANQEQQRRQQESQGLVSGYPSRATGLTALSVPLAAWEGFTSLASHLPGDAGDSMLRMNREARQMQDSFAQMAAQMLGVDGQEPAQQAGLQNDQQRLETTGEQADASDQHLQTASDGADALQQANTVAHAEARRREQAATDRAGQCTDAAAEREEHATTLAEQLRTWASAHAAARRQAIADTTARLEGDGRTIVGVSER